MDPKVPFLSALSVAEGEAQYTYAALLRFPLPNFDAKLILSLPACSWGKMGWLVGECLSPLKLCILYVRYNTVRIFKNRFPPVKYAQRNTNYSPPKKMEWSAFLVVIS